MATNSPAAVKQEHLELSKAWDVSTVHITQSDANLLEAAEEETNYPVVHSYREGFWLVVPDNDGWNELIRTNCLEKFGFSPSISLILSIARNHKVRYVRIDADAPIYDFLPEYHW
jgi:hypothetical protein